MQEIENKKERKRSAYGLGPSQKMVTFRCDVENLEFLATRENKGRFLNELISWYRQQFKG